MNKKMASILLTLLALVLSNVQISLGQGSCSLSETLIGNFNTPRGLTSGDMNGDGFDDLIVAYGDASESRAISLLLGNSSGSFTEVDITGDLLENTSFSQRVTVFGLVEPADYDGDGDLDFSLVGLDQVPQTRTVSRIIRNDGGGVFSVAYQAVFGGGGLRGGRFADFDGDDDLDIMWSIGTGNYGTGDIFYARNLGTGFGPRESAGGWFQECTRGDIVVADFNGDSQADLAFSSFGCSRVVSVGLTDSQLNFSYATFGDNTNDVNRDIQSIDFDGDGDLDIVGAFNGNPRDVVLFENDGSGVFALHTEPLFEDLASIGELESIDVDGDDKQDIVSLSDSAISIWRNQGNGFFDLATTKQIAGLDDYTILDFSGGGKHDIAYFDGSGNLKIAISDCCLLGDTNGDGVVSLLDVQSFVDIIISGIFDRAADTNRDGIVSLLDVGTFVNLIIGVSPSSRTVVGTTGDDEIVVSGDSCHMSVTVNGQTSNLFGVSELVVNGFAGNDTITVNITRPVTVNAGEGDDTVTTTGIGATQLFGGPGNDVIVGGMRGDIINGGGGLDIIEGGSGNDTIDGAGGDDEISGGDGNDQLLGGLGDDQIFGGGGEDSLTGGPGLDFFDGGPGYDTAVDEGELGEVSIENS